jgi:micrococcal nuclease
MTFFKTKLDKDEYIKALEQITPQQRDTLMFGKWEDKPMNNLLSFSHHIDLNTQPEEYKKALKILNTPNPDLSISQESPMEFRKGMQYSMPAITGYMYNGSIYKWIDGDTVEVVLDLGLKIAHRTIVRLHGLNAPEKNTEEGQLLIEHLNLNYPSNSVIVVQTIKDKKEKYGRYLANIYCNNININEYLLANNFAKILKY